MVSFRQEYSVRERFSFLVIAYSRLVALRSIQVSRVCLIAASSFGRFRPPHLLSGARVLRFSVFAFHARAAFVSS